LGHGVVRTGVALGVSCYAESFLTAGRLLSVCLSTGTARYVVTLCE